MDKKICAVCLTVGKPAMITAAWVSDELIMAERTNYPERRRAMELKLLREKEEKDVPHIRGDKTTLRISLNICLSLFHASRRVHVSSGMRGGTTRVIKEVHASSRIVS